MQNSSRPGIREIILNRPVHDKADTALLQINALSALPAYRNAGGYRSGAECRHSPRNRDCRL